MPFGQKDGRVRVVLDTSVALLDELADVLSRNKLAAKLQEQ